MAEYALGRDELIALVMTLTFAKPVWLRLKAKIWRKT